MDLVNLIQAYDGCKRLGLEKSSKRLERAIDMFTASLLKKVREQVKGEDDDVPETTQPA